MRSDDSVPGSGPDDRDACKLGCGVVHALICEWDMDDGRKCIRRFSHRGEHEAETTHPEAICQRCNGPNVLSWHAPSPLWNRVMRRSDGSDRYSVVCPTCFAELAARLVPNETWCFKPHGVEVRGLWWDADCRQWDVENCLWAETIDSRAAAAARELAVDPSVAVQ